MENVTISITSEMLRLIAEIDEFKGKWSVTANLAPDRLARLQHVATIESIGSSTRIEGATLSDQEVEALISGVKTHNFHTRDEEEVGGYAYVMDMLFESADHIPLTENGIKHLHHSLLQYTQKDQYHLGQYKKFPNHVEAKDSVGNSLGIVFETASPFDTVRLMEELVLWLQEQIEQDELHPLLTIAIFIVRFLAIHPFQDGNGRLSRILTTLLLLKKGYSYATYSSLESIIEHNKDRYYLALRKTQSTLTGDDPQWEPWILFFLRSLKKQKDHLSIKMKRELSLASSLPELSTTIIELIREHGRLSTGELEKLTHAKRGTIKSHLRKLVANNHLLQHGQGRGTWYTLP